jgi:organic hydroperoxide reductase OsmC/OhrA
MSEHKAIVSWNRNGLDFGYKAYSRNHTWTFENGATLEASAATQYLGDPSRVDPEQAFVGSLSSCHLLTFLALASFQKLTVESYEDNAVGQMMKNEAGKMVISRVDLFPKIVFAAGIEPTRQQLEALHHKAHEECFLANSVTCEIVTHIE